MSRQGPIRSARRDDSRESKGGISKFLKAVLGIFSFMAKLSDEKRAELVVELDKINTEVRSLVGAVR